MLYLLINIGRRYYLFIENKTPPLWTFPQLAFQTSVFQNKVENINLSIDYNLYEEKSYEFIKMLNQNSIEEGKGQSVVA